MVDALMIQSSNRSISCVFIGVGIRTRDYPSFDVIFNRVAVYILDDYSFSLATMVTHSEHWGRADRTAACVLLLRLVFIRFLATEKCLISSMILDKRAATIAICFTEPCEHEPGSLLGNHDLFGELQGRDALSSSDNNIDGVQPLVYWNMIPLKDGSSANREVTFASKSMIAAFDVVGLDTITSSALGTSERSVPATVFDIRPGLSQYRL